MNNRINSTLRINNKRPAKSTNQSLKVVRPKPLTKSNLLIRAK